MIIEITTYTLADGLTHEELTQASKDFTKDYCLRCKGLISRELLKTDKGYMDIFKWESKADAERVQATFMEDIDALKFAKHLNQDTLSMNTYKVIESYGPKRN